MIYLEDESYERIQWKSFNMQKKRIHEIITGNPD